MTQKKTRLITGNMPLHILLIIVFFLIIISGVKDEKTEPGFCGKFIWVILEKKYLKLCSYSLRKIFIKVKMVHLP